MPFPRFSLLALAFWGLPVLAVTPSVSSSRTPRAVTAKSAASPVSWKYNFAEDALESRWSWRGRLVSKSAGEARVVFGWRNPQNYAFLRLQRTASGTFASLGQVQNGKVALGPSVVFPLNQGEIGLQTVGTRVRALWNGYVVLQTRLTPALARKGAQFGTASRGGVTVDGDDVQPTATVVFRDDFMRATGPNDSEVPGEWKTAGLWKTSGTLGPKSDAALNPNPFVFRASSASQGRAENRARAGKWFWSDYTVSASVRATQNDLNAPLTAALEAFGQSTGASVRGEIDFRSGVARIKQGNQILAQSTPFGVETGGWHRVLLEPGPNVARLLVDGIERVRARTTLAQGTMALVAQSGGSNFVDFDDVRVGSVGAKTEYGETLPERFKMDRLIRYWANDSQAWKRDETGTWWHTGDFFGAAKLEVPLPKLQAVGDGVQIRLGAPVGATNKGITDVLAEVKRVNVGQVRVSLDPRLGNNLVRVLEWKMGAAQPVIFSFTPGAAGVGTSTLQLGQAVLRIPTRRSPNATKVAVCPLRAGKPLPPPLLRPLSITSGTYEREGRAVVGVNITPVTRSIAREIGLPDALGTVVDYLDPDSPATKAGIEIGDVVRGVNGATVADVDSMRAAVGAVRPGADVTLQVLRPQMNTAGIDWEKCRATTPQVIDYSFTSAPVDWRGARGKWEVAERWTCSPQWSFFAGGDDVAPLLWSRFATKGDWTLEAYLATPMDLARGERSPSDLNVTVEGDGRNLSSGYSFVFSAKNRTLNRIYKGDAVAWEKPFEIPPGVGDTHQDWFYVRIERRATPKGLNFRWSVNGREIANYLDAKPRGNGGALAFWTKNGGLSMARVRLWHSGVSPQTVPAALPRNGAQTMPVNLGLGSESSNTLGTWSVRGEGAGASARLSLLPFTLPTSGENEATTQPLRLENPQCGGDWTVYATRDEFDPRSKPVLEWDYTLPGNVKLNLYAKVGGFWREIVFSGPVSDNSNGNQPLGKVDKVVADGQWHHARFDLLSALRQFGLAESRVEALAFAAPDVDYLRAGLGGNPLGTSWQLHAFTARER